MRIGRYISDAGEAHLSDIARPQHVYVTGQTGAGKSTLLKTIAIQDMAAGHGLCFIDPHGKDARELLRHVPENRLTDLIFIDLADQERPVGLNFMSDVPPEHQNLYAQNFVKAWHDVFHDIGWGARMEEIFVRTVQTLMENDLPLLALPRLFHDKPFQERCTRNLKDSYLRNTFWPLQYPEWAAQFKADLTSPIENKISGILGTPATRQIFGQKRNTFKIPEAMQSQKLIIVALSMGRIGHQAACLYAALLVSSIVQGALLRDPEKADQVKPFSLIMDEFHLYATLGIPLALSGVRKFGLWMTLAHQGRSQLKEKVAEAIFENVGTMALFRVGPDDARLLAKQIQRDEPALTELPNFEFWYRPLQEGIPGTAQVVATKPPPQPLHDKAELFRIVSQRTYGRPADIVNARIDEFWEAGRASVLAQRSERKKAKAASSSRADKRRKSDPGS